MTSPRSHHRPDGYYWIQHKAGPDEPEVAHWRVWETYDGRIEAEWECPGLDYGLSDDAVTVMSGRLTLEALKPSVIDMLAMIDLQAKALLSVEWAGECKELDCCPACYAAAPWRDPGGEHELSCPFDKALYVVGLDTQEKRDGKRKELGL